MSLMRDNGLSFNFLFSFNMTNASMNGLKGFRTTGDDRRDSHSIILICYLHGFRYHLFHRERFVQDARKLASLRDRAAVGAWLPLIWVSQSIVGIRFNCHISPIIKGTRVSSKNKSVKRQLN